MPICPDCYLELTPETRQCPDCGIEPVATEELAPELEWPHCSQCGTAAAESDTRCRECGQRFYFITLLPRATALLAAVATFFIFAFLLGRMGLSTNTMKIVGVIAGGMVWYLLRLRTNLVLKTAPIAWSDLPIKVREDLRQTRK